MKNKSALNQGQSMKNLIVIGNGMVGHHFIEKAIEKKLAPNLSDSCI